MIDELKQWEQDKGYIQGKSYMLQKIEDIKAEILKQKHNHCCNFEMMAQNIAYDTALNIINKHIESEGDNDKSREIQTRGFKSSR